MPHIITDHNLSQYYKDDNPSGSPVVILIHGLGVTGDSWVLQIPALIQAGFRVISPDIRGFGRSGYLNERISIVTLAQDVRYLINTLGIAPVDLVGISLGGTIALQTVLDEPQVVHRAILVNTFARLRPKKIRTWIYLAMRFVAASLFGLRYQAHVVGHGLFPSPDQAYLRQELYNQIMLANPKAYRGATRALARFDVRHRLSEIQNPVLVVTGEMDTTVPVDTQTKLAKGIKNSKHIIIPGAGHGVTVEKPDLFNAAILEFLRT
jgi:pimeloyl-ACP methyl ester carboxylesterase